MSKLIKVISASSIVASTLLITASISVIATRPQVIKQEDKEIDFFNKDPYYTNPWQKHQDAWKFNENNS